MKNFLLSLFLLGAFSAQAATNRTLNGTAIQYGPGGNILSLPNTTDTLVARSTADTLSSKTLASAIFTGTFTGPWATAGPLITNSSGVVTSEAQLAVARGGTGISSGSSGGVLYFSSTGALASTSVLSASQLVLGNGAGFGPGTLGSLGTTTQVLHGNASGAPTWSAIQNGDLGGPISAAKGGSGIDTSGSTGIPSIAAGTWSVIGTTGTGSVMLAASPTTTGTFSATGQSYFGSGAGAQIAASNPIGVLSAPATSTSNTQIRAQSTGSNNTRISMAADNSTAYIITGGSTTNPALVFSSNDSTTALMTLSNAGALTITGAFTGTATGVQHVMGATADPGSAKTTLTVRGSTTGYTNAAGLAVLAGTSINDYSAIFNNAANTVTLLGIQGNGKVVTAKNTLDDASGNLFISSNSTNTAPGIRVGDPANAVDGAPYIRLQGSSTNFNWQFSNNFFTAGTLEWTPSASAGNTTFSTPVMKLSPAGALTISSKLTVNSGSITQPALLNSTGVNSFLAFTDASTSSGTRVQIGSSANTFIIDMNGSVSFTADGASNIVVGTSTAANATGGWLYLSASPGTPTGVPGTTYGSHVPMVYDTTNHKICVYDPTTPSWRCSAAM